MKPCPHRTVVVASAVRVPARRSFAAFVGTPLRFGAPMLLALQLAPARAVEPVRVGLDGDPIETSLGLRADIYSPSAVELFWGRIDVPGVRYEVRENGEWRAETDGASFYVDDLPGGRDPRLPGDGLRRRRGRVRAGVDRGDDAARRERGARRAGSAGAGRNGRTARPEGADLLGDHGRALLELGRLRRRRLRGARRRRRARDGPRHELLPRVHRSRRADDVRGRRRRRCR